MNDVYEGYIAHYGVKGQKWGVRRYQNEDGSLTTAGKHRYGFLDRIGLKKDNSTKESDTSKSSKNEETGKKIKKVLAISAGVGVAALAAYGIHKGLSNYDERYFKDLNKGIDPLRAFSKDLDESKAYMVPKGSHLQRMSLFDESNAQGRHVR